MPGLAALECGWISGYALAWQSVCVYGIYVHLYLHCFCSWDYGTFVAWNIMRLCHGGVSLCVGKLETCICIYLVSVNDGVARTVLRRPCCSCPGPALLTCRSCFHDGSKITTETDTTPIGVSERDAYILHSSYKPIAWLYPWRSAGTRKANLLDYYVCASSQMDREHLHYIGSLILLSFSDREFCVMTYKRVLLQQIEKSSPLY